MAVLSLIGSIIPLLLLIFQEFFSAQGRARQANEKFTLDQEKLKEIVGIAVERWNERNAQDSVGAGSAWDQADQDLKPGPKNDPDK
jgi:hypothetical protein